MKRSSLGLPFVCQLWVAGMLLVACGGNGHKGGGALHNDTAQKRPAQPAQSDRAGTDTSLLTIAAINELPDGQNIEIRFFERAAAFSVPKSDKVFSANSELLRKALADNTPVKFVLAPRSNRIAQIIMPTEMEVRAYNTGSGLNSPDLRIKSTVPITVDLTKIDTATFNRVERLRFPAFKLCGSVVPNYATLVTIFNYCASQGCNVPGPYTIPNCIPFQYVIDGCYARAHKMRQIIGKQYGYCCEKVFSYGISPSTLAVKADKWGGCCVRWWYHVAPLLRVTVKRGASSFQLAYVIDPGMFNGPVTLSTWLNAQKNTACASNANVTSYSIQPGSAYAPSNGGYSTDPNYTATEQTLVAYKNGVTCN